MWKLIVAGSRTFNDYQLLKSKLDFYINNNEVEIVSGTARGADRLGEKYAQERNYKITRFLADWNKFGKGAGYKRNEQMAKYATHAVIFWDGSSPGTKHMIKLAKQYLDYRIVKV
jgi:hypothetical protein